MAVRNGGGYLLKKKILVTFVLKNPGKNVREHRENTWNLTLTRTWPP